VRPDMLTALTDEVGAAATRKRAAASVSRTARWLDACLAAWAAAGMAAPLLAPVTGALHAEERARSAREAAARDGVAGFALTGGGMLPWPGQHTDQLNSYGCSTDQNDVMMGQPWVRSTTYHCPRCRLWYRREQRRAGSSARRSDCRAARRQTPPAAGDQQGRPTHWGSPLLLTTRGAKSRQLGAGRGGARVGAVSSAVRRGSV
jgi:Queuine tRNA-ribosyltransferase